MKSQAGGDWVMKGQVGGDCVMKSQVRPGRVMKSQVGGDCVMKSQVGGDCGMKSQVGGDCVMKSQVGGDCVMKSLHKGGFEGMMRLGEEQELNQTGMALLEVGLLSGFTLAQDGVQTNNYTKKVEEEPGKVFVYLDSSKLTHRARM
ncbi:unnamed protein product [Boreogadus saida]